MKTLFFLLTFVFLAPDVVAQGFAQETPIQQNSPTHSVRIGDLDGDGDLDVAAVNWTENTLVWYENLDGFGQYSSAIVISTSTARGQRVEVADFDNDGNLDLLTAAEGDDQVAWHRNIDGHGTFSGEIVIGTLNGDASWAHPADLDGDGDVDVLTASRGSRVSWFENGGNGSFGVEQIISTNASNTQSVFAADLDGDGDLDALSASCSDNKVAWYENTDGQGTWGPQQVITTSALCALFVTAADLDNDGDQDVISASQNDRTIRWFENEDGLGTFSAGITLEVTTANGYAAEAVDLDSDGDLDVVTAFSDRLSWHRNEGGTFVFAETIRTSFEAFAVTSGDIDLDGDLDLITSSRDNRRIDLFRNTIPPAFPTVSLTLIASDGTPISGQRVDLLRANGSNTGIRTTTDASGQATFEVDAEAQHQLKVYHNGGSFTSQILSEGEHATIQTGASTLTLLSSVGVPISNQRVDLLRANSSNTGIRIRTDMDGEAAFEILPNYEHAFKVYYNGGSYITANVVFDTDLTVQTGTSTLTLLNSGGLPIANQRVDLLRANGSNTGIRIRTDIDGEATFEILPDYQHQFKVYHHGGSYIITAIT